MTSSARTILSVQNMQVCYGPRIILDGIDFDIRDQSVTAIIGPNGAGKSTLFDVLSGFKTSRSGEVMYRGQRVTNWRPDQRAVAGLIRTFQHGRVIKRMRVIDNVKLGAVTGRLDNFLSSVLRVRKVRQYEASATQRAMGLLAQLGVAHLADEYGGVLSGGQRKLVALARALIMEPTVLLLDEPFAGVNPLLREEISASLVKLRQERGMTIVFVEHDMEAVQRIADDVIVLGGGRILAHGDPPSVMTNKAVVDAYLGGTSQGWKATRDS